MYEVLAGIIWFVIKTEKWKQAEQLAQTQTICPEFSLFHK